ncbi:hypothetical protein MC885_000638 [Smutsia gigantea]|nr:hypothetical protein MC885_000638 [Smutsia gigantea]
MKMNSFHSSSGNTSAELLNKSWNKEFAYQTLSLVDTVIFPSMVGIICSTGLVGNILIVFTITRSRKKTVPDIYICNLAVADLVHITGMPFLIHQWARGGEWVFGGPLCTTITSLDTCNQFACSAIMTVMSVDRYLALVQPFRLRGWRTRYTTIRINLGLWAASLILALPVWVYSKVITFKDGVESCAFDFTSPDDVLCIGCTPREKLSASLKVYALFDDNNFFFPFAFDFGVLYFNFMLYLGDVSTEQGCQMSCIHIYNPGIPKQRVMKLTKMVLVLVAVSILSAAPYHVIQLVNLQVEQPTLAFYVGYYLSVCLSYASSSVNPFLYILLSGNFRKRLPQVQRRPSLSYLEMNYPQCELLM